MRLQASGEVRAVSHKDGTSKAGNDYRMTTVRLLTPDIDVTEVVFFGTDVRVPAVGDAVRYDVEATARGGNLNVQAVRELPSHPLTEALAEAAFGVADDSATAPEGVYS